MTADSEERHLPFTRWPRSDEVDVAASPTQRLAPVSRLGCGGRAKLFTAVDLARAVYWVAD